LQKILVLVLLSFVLSACKNNNSQENFSVKLDEKIICINLASEPETIDPVLNTAADSADMIYHMFEGLMKWQDSGELINNINLAEITNGQAKSYIKTNNQDGTVSYKFILRDDIKWSDGKKVSAQDFEYSWKRTVDPETQAPYGYILSMVHNAQEILDGKLPKENLGIKALDDKTLEIILDYDCEYFLEICAFPVMMPLREDMINSQGDQWTFEPESYISNGAFKLTDWVHNSYIDLIPNENYYDKNKIKINKLRFVLISNAESGLNAFKNNELDFIQAIPENEIESLKQQEEFMSDLYLGTYYVSFQTQKSPFDNLLVRKAFSLAIDRNYLVENITRANQVPAGAFVAFGIKDKDLNQDFRKVGGDFYSVLKSDYQANCDQARKFMTEAGYPNGNNFPIVEYVYNGESNQAIAEALQDMWKQVLGVTVELNNQDWSVMLEMHQSGEYQIMSNRWIADFKDAISFLNINTSWSGNNAEKYFSQNYDELINKSNSSSPDRIKFLHQAEELLIKQDCVKAPLFFLTNARMLKKNITGVFYMPLGSYFFMYADKN